MLVTSSMLVQDTVATNVNSKYSSSKAHQMQTPYFLRLFSGQRPTREQIRSLTLASTSEAYYAMTRLPALLTSLGGRAVISVGNISAVLLVDWTPSKIAIQLSKIAEVATSLQDDQITWGLVYMLPRTANASPDSWEATVLNYFTVGSDLNSDVMIPDGFIPKGTVWKPIDLEITVQGGIQ